MPLINGVTFHLHVQKEAKNSQKIWMVFLHFSVDPELQSFTHALIHSISFLTYMHTHNVINRCILMSKHSECTPHVRLS